MSNDKSGWALFFSQSARRMAGPLSVLGMTVLTPLPAMAQEGVLVFRGQLVNSTCDMQPSAQRNVAPLTTQVQVQPGVFLDVNTQHNACTGETVPFSTHVETVAPPGSRRKALQSVASSRDAVVVITYQ